MKTSKFILLPLLALGLTAGSATIARAQSAAPATQVYVSQLPSPTALISAANAQNMTVNKIEQGSGQITAVYKSANGQLNTVTYLPLPANEAAASAAPAVAAPAAGATTTTVVYGPGYAPYYYPYGWYPPVAIGIGFGWRGGWGWGGRGWGGRWR